VFDKIMAEGVQMTAAAIIEDFAHTPMTDMLGWRLLKGEPGSDSVTFGYDAKPEFRNAAGFIQIGMLSAMIDSTIAALVLIASEGKFFASTLNLTLNFPAPALPGAIMGEGQILQMGATIAFVEARLLNADGAVLVTASATARLTSTDYLKKQDGPRSKKKA
jgi:acyl-coenzyme A thioesterase PaaI-like protein